MDEIKLDITGMVETDGKKVSYIRFSRGDDYAEGYIPDCVFTKVKGFTDEETARLADYLRENLQDLKKRAADINPLNALLEKK